MKNDSPACISMYLVDMRPCLPTCDVKSDENQPHCLGKLGRFQVPTSPFYCLFQTQARIVVAFGCEMLYHGNKHRHVRAGCLLRQTNRCYGFRTITRERIRHEGAERSITKQNGRVYKLQPCRPHLDLLSIQWSRCKQAVQLLVPSLPIQLQPCRERSRRVSQLEGFHAGPHEIFDGSMVVRSQLRQASTEEGQLHVPRKLGGVLDPALSCGRVHGPALRTPRRRRPGAPTARRHADGSAHRLASLVPSASVHVLRSEKRNDRSRTMGSSSNLSPSVIQFLFSTSLPRPTIQGTNEEISIH